MYQFVQQSKGLSRKARDILILAICALIVLNALQFLLYRSATNRDAALREALVARARQDVDAAQRIVPQLSRTGGSYAYAWLSQTRQYLYGVTQLNDLAGIVFGAGRTLLPQAAVDAATAAIDGCEAKLLSGSAIDMQLNELRQQLNILSDAAGTLAQ